MSSHADIDDHVHRIAGYIKGTEALDDLDALVAKYQRLRGALTEIVALYDRPETGRRKTAAMVARAALDGRDA